MEWEGELAHYRHLFAEIFRHTEHNEAIMWVAEKDGFGIIGQLFVHLESPRPDLADGETRAYIYGFRVRPRFQGQGIGTQMMQVAEEDLRRRGFRIVSLNVGQDNDGARRLYERLGYQVVGPDPGRWSYIDHHGVVQNVHEPAWKMQKRLSDP